MPSYTHEALNGQLPLHAQRRAEAQRRITKTKARGEPVPATHTTRANVLINSLSALPATNVVDANALNEVIVRLHQIAARPPKKHATQLWKESKQLFLRAMGFTHIR